MNASDAVLHAFTVSIQPARRAWMQAVTAVLTDKGPSQSLPLALVVLLVSRLGNGVSQRTLAAEVGVNPAALVRTLDQGETVRLLKRRDARNDRRSKVVDLLPKGKRLAERMEKKLEALRRKLLADVPGEDVETATRVLRMLESRTLAHVKAVRKD